MLATARCPPQAGELSDEKYNAALGRALHALRTDAGRTQEDVAAAAGVSTYYLRQLEHGRGSATVSVLVRLAAAFHTRPSELLRRAEAE